jgi:hypothetical protein
MIVFETAAAPAVRAGEAEIGGRRIAGRLSPYVGESRPLRFDVVRGRFVFRKPEAAVRVGPADGEPWSEAVSRLPAGPVLVGPCSDAEEVRGAYRAAAAGALEAGRSVYLLDPEAAGLPDDPRGAVVLCSWRPGGSEAFPSLLWAAKASLPCGVLFPLIPGWTAESAAIEALLSEAHAGGAVSATALRPESDGEGRRAIVEARAAVDPDAADRFFEVIHHTDWSSRVADRLGGVRAACQGHGLATLPPRPVGRREPAGNRAAASRLEELADSETADEHRAALLRAAVRWIDESGRDLCTVAREGNFRKIFPFEDEIAKAAEVVLRERC